MFANTLSFENYVASIICLFKDVQPSLFEKIKHRLDNPVFFETIRQRFAADIKLSAALSVASPLFVQGRPEYESSEEQLLSEFHVKMMGLY